MEEALLLMNDLIECLSFMYDIWKFYSSAITFKMVNSVMLYMKHVRAAILQNKNPVDLVSEVGDISKLASRIFQFPPNYLTEIERSEMIVRKTKFIETWSLFSILIKESV